MAAVLATPTVPSESQPIHITPNVPGWTLSKWCGQGDSNPRPRPRWQPRPDPGVTCVAEQARGVSGGHGVQHGPEAPGAALWHTPPGSWTPDGPPQGGSGADAR